MRVALVFDMEGTSHIGDVREPFPMYREYWASGRPKLTDEVAAAARGLLGGGATEVWVVNHHGGGDAEWPNLVAERLPNGARAADDWSMLEAPRAASTRYDVSLEASPQMTSTCPVRASGSSRHWLSRTMPPTSAGRCT